MIRFALALVFIVASLSAATARNPMPGWMAPPGASGGGGSAIADSLRAHGLGQDSSAHFKNMVCDSCTFTGVNIGGGEGILYKPDQSTIMSLPHGAVGQVLQSRGPGLPPVFTNPASIQAFVYGPGDELVSNPQLANQAAKFIRVTDTIRIVAGSDFASNPVLVDGTSRYVEVVQAPGITEYDAVASGAPSENLRGVAYGGGVYVLVAESGKIYAGPSLDSLTITWGGSGTVPSLNDVIWDAYTSKFWAVGASGTILSSSDGVTWSAVSLPPSVQSDNLTGIATDGSGTFAVSNSTTAGARGLVSTDGGDTFATVNFNGSTQTMVYTGDWFMGGRTSGGFGAVAYASSSSPTGGTWGTGTIPGSAGTVQSIIVSGNTVILGTSNGDIGTVPTSSTPTASNITLRRTGTGEAVRLFAANGRVYAVGQNGLSLESSDNGVTWQAGPPVGTSQFLRKGISDPKTNSRAIVVGDGGTILVGQYPVVISAYDTPQNRTDKKGLGIFEYDAGTSAAGNLRGIAHGAGLYARVGLGGLIETSPDLVTWTARTSGVSVQLNFVIYDSHTAKFWAVGASGTMLSSSDGITWSSVSLPVEVATDNLTGIATDGSGTFVVSNNTTGARGLVSTDGGDTFAIVNFTGSTFPMVYTGDWFIGGRTSGGIVAYVSASNPTGTWSTGTLSGSSGGLISITLSGSNVIVGTTNGDIGTIPISSTPSTDNITLRRTGDGSSIRLFAANGRVYAVGNNGLSLESTDNGVTWQAGPSVGTTSFLRFGVTDANDPTRAIVVGDGGTMLIGRYPVVATTYPDLPASITLVGSASFDLDALAPADLPLNIDVLRQFKSTAYASTADRSAETSPLGNAFYTYSETPLVVTIPGQITFQIGILTPGDVPFNFDVYTISDLIYISAIVQNASLSPGPYYCYNCVYDFGADDRFEYGPESNNQYATVFIQNSTSGNFYFLRSAAPGDAADPITAWDTLMTITNEGVSMVPATQDWDSGDLSINPYSEQVINTYNGTPVSRTATLPALSTVNIGKRVCVSAGTSSITETYAITILPDGTDTINGSSSYLEISAPYGGYCLVSAGTTWVIQEAF